MNARELEQARDELRLRRRRALETAVVACVAAVAALAVSWVLPRLAVALAVGAAVQGAVALGVLHTRRERIARLALDPDAYAIPEVDGYGRHCVRERKRLAAWLASLAGLAAEPGSLVLPDRVAQFAHELDTLARELASSAARVQPVSAVACRRLLTHAVDSPLYNPRVPPDELQTAIQRIRGGIDLS